MYATVRTADRQGLSRDKELTVAIAKVNPNYVSFLMDNFLNWKIAYYDSVEAAFQAVADGEADAGLLNNYRINRLLDLLTLTDFLRLTTSTTERRTTYHAFDKDEDFSCDNRRYHRNHADCDSFWRDRY